MSGLPKGGDEKSRPREFPPKAVSPVPPKGGRKIPSPLLIGPKAPVPKWGRARKTLGPGPASFGLVKKPNLGPGDLRPRSSSSFDGAEEAEEDGPGNFRSGPESGFRGGVFEGREDRGTPRRAPGTNGPEGFPRLECWVEGRDLSRARPEGFRGFGPYCLQTVFLGLRSDEGTRGPAESRVAYFHRRGR